MPGERRAAEPDEVTHEVTMVPVDPDDDNGGYDDYEEPDTAPVRPLRLAHSSGSSPEGA